MAQKRRIKIIKLSKVSKDKIGRIVINNIHMETHEYETMMYLTLYGFDIEVIRPISAPKVRNSDILMLGTVWEMKAPTSHNLKTMKKRIHKASLQARRAIFDLRRIKCDYETVEKYLIETFIRKSDLRRMMIITKEGDLLDIRK